MELPSMVQRSGDTLIVRSVVSGNPIYMDQGTTASAVNNNNNTTSNNNNNNNNNMNCPPTMTGGGSTPLSNTLMLEQFEQFKRAQEQLMHQQQQQQHHQQQHQQQQSLAEEQQRQQAAAAMDLKEEGLPQCKIKRNYSCNYCTYFTQNPRSHLTHLRDVHGEKIVINKCKLCLYASRHYQKLVRHMKMVHGCTDGIASGHGQARGKRGINREARKRKLEECVVSPRAINAMSVEAINAEHQIKSDMEQKLQRDIEAFKKQQEEQQKCQQQQLSEAIFAAAYEQQLRVQRELDREALKAAHSSYEHPSPSHNAGDSPSQNQLPAHKQQSVHTQQIPPQRSSIELTPSPSGSNSSPPPPQTPSAGGQSQPQESLSGGSVTPGTSSDEPSNNRLMKCSLCDFTTLYRNLLLEHENEDHCNAKFYRCEKCSYVTHIKARFSKHVKYHSMPMIKCVTCDFRTPYKWNLDRHMKNHGGAGPFKCAACDFTADIKQSLTVHEMNHHVPPVGHAAGMTLARRRLKVGGTDLNEDFFSDSADMLEDHFNNNNMDEYDEMLMTAGPIETYESKRLRYDDDEPTDLSQKGGSSDTSSVHNSNLSMPKVKKPLPNLIPIIKESENILNLSSDLASRSSLSDIASMFFNEKQISEMLQPMDNRTETAASVGPQLSPTTTITSSASGRSLLNRKAGSFFDKIKSSSTTNENLICPCGHMAKCLSESIIHRKTCTFSPLSANDEMDLDDDDHDEDGDEGRLEIDFTEDDEFDKQSHSALNLSVSGSTRCRHCRHRCKSSADLINHLKICSEANSRCDSLSGDSCAGSRAGNMGDSGTAGSLQHPMENRVFIWNKLPRNQQEGSSGGGVGGMGIGISEGNRQQADSGYASLNAGSSLLSANNDENSYYGVETAPGYGEVTKKMTPEEEAANSSLKKVYKCPHCSFWASTASRFHVHIVGHLNKKPFECSLCSYRSNWRWDITKHIRLKTIRDPSHKNARVLMNDETGRRNYTKYNKYITLMKVTEEDGDPKLMKSGEMTPNQVASLAFINDYNNKQQQGSSATLNPTVSSILNGVREDITIEPVPPKSSGLLTPMLTSTIPLNDNSQHNDNDQSGATLITPSVSISAYKKDLKSYLNGEFTQEIRHEGNKEVPYYKCRKCNYTHTNREPLQFHTLLHVLEERLTIASTNTDSNASMPVTSNPNAFISKTAAAMGLSQQQQQQKQSQLSTLISTGLPEQANNLQLSSLALALAGKSPLKSTQLNATPNILEHGEQKASQNEASAQNTSSSTSPNQLTSKQQLKQIHATSASSSVTVTGVGSTSSTSSPSLQHLLTSPRGSISQKTQTNQNDALNSIISNNNTSDSIMVLGTTLAKNNKNGTATPSPSATPTPTTIVTTTTTITSNNNSPPPTTPNHQTYPMPMPSPHLSQFNIDCDVHDDDGGGGGDGAGAGDGGIGCGGGILLTSGDIGGIKDHNHRHHSTLVNNNVMATALYAATTAAASPSCSASLLSLSNQNYTQNQNQNQTQNQSHSSSSSNNSNSNSNLGILVTGFGGNGLSNNNNNNNCNNNINNYNNGNGNGNGNSNSNANGNGNHNNSNLLTHDTTTADRRDPSPYRCGHCHQVSNWKHVIQRHCRLKHAGVINIETLDRTASADRHAAPIYKPLVNGASNEANNNHIISNSNAGSSSQLNLTLKALQQQQQQQHHNSVLNNNNNNNNNNNINNNNNNTLNNSVIKTDNNDLKFEQTHALLNSQLTSAIATLNAANTPQEIMACAAAAHRMTGNTLARLHDMASIIGELMLKKQLLQNDQIEITRVTSSNHHNNKSTGNTNNILTIQPAPSNTNLAQLLEANNTQMNRTASPQNNTKSKQQKCPLCTYICDSKSQMNYHISLHKPTQYECHKCTFVCAKKQHLSAHMRTVHQINQNHTLPVVVPQATNAIATNSINMDLGLALQMATAAQKPDPSTLPTPLAIDLSSSTIPQSNQIHQGQLPPEYQYRMIYYCPKCPARYAQKHNDPLTAQKDLDEHRRQHELPAAFGAEDKRKYHCDYCDYRAMHESIIQTHRHVHTSQYQEKCNELYKNCKEDSVYRAPKLMHITAARKPHLHETIWVVDHDLNDGHQLGKHHQNSVITSSCQSSSFETGNSLLKKQLESRQSPTALTPTPTPTPNEEVGKNTCKSTQSIAMAEDVAVAEAEAEDSNTASTSASVATGDLAHDNELQQAIIKTLTKEQAFNQSRKPVNVKEKCEHCPFESTNESDLKSHLQQHICVNKQKLAFVCDHCDYTAAEHEQIDEHTRVHFNGIEKLKDVAFFTSYDKLEISIEQKDVVEESEEEKAVVDLDIKQELLNHNNNNNNNNEEDRINENLKETTQDITKSLPSMETTTDKQQPPPKCAKIILYKNDGCLSIKKEACEQSQQQQQQQPQHQTNTIAENISDRLRRRISRQGGAGISTTINSNEEPNTLTSTSMQSTSHKTILVHAKTGQVISRN